MIYGKIPDVSINKVLGYPMENSFKGSTTPRTSKRSPVVSLQKVLECALIWLDTKVSW